MAVLTPPSTQTKECPKCGLVAPVSATECPKCGVVIDKAAEIARRRREQREQASLGEGLDVLRETDLLQVQQQVERLEMWTGIETANQYVVKDAGCNSILFAAEEPGGAAEFISRMFLEQLRPFTIHVESLHGNSVLKLDRPFRFYFQELHVKNAQGVVIGTVQREFSILNRKYTVRYQNGRAIYELFGPLFRPWTFKIMRGGQECGAIRKRWSGLGKEWLTDADTFGIEFPPGIDEGLKAVFLGAVFLIDFVHFEDNND